MSWLVGVATLQSHVTHRDVDAAAVDLSTSDPWAFNYWGTEFKKDGIRTDPEDREIQSEFWLRHIGNTRKRLAEDFRRFFLPIAVYSEDPALAVQNKISLADLTRLYEELPEDETLTNRDRQSLATLRRFLDGDFKNGIDPVSNIYREDEAPLE
jgi:hypothetical protein